MSVLRRCIGMKTKSSLEIKMEDLMKLPLVWCRYLQVI